MCFFVSYNTAVTQPCVVPLFFRAVRPFEVGSIDIMVLSGIPHTFVDHTPSNNLPTVQKGFILL